MRKIIVSEFVTLDGVMEAPGGETSLGERGGWTFPFWSDEQGKFKAAELLAADTLLLGRNTYDGFAKAWPAMKDPAGFADKMNSMPKYVVSTTLQNPEWNNTHVIKENIPEEIAKLKAEPGKDILVFGSATLLQTLIAHNLVDEYQLMVFPVILGTGKHLFQEASEKKHLKLLGTKMFSSGVVILSYEPTEIIKK